MSPLRGKKTQNRPPSKLNNRRFALREMLPVKKEVTQKTMCSDDTVQAIVRGVSPDGEYEDEHELHSIIMTGSNRLGRDNLQIVCMSKTIEVIGIWKAG